MQKPIRFDTVIVRHFEFDPSLYRHTLEATSGEWSDEDKNEYTNDNNNSNSCSSSHDNSNNSMSKKDEVVVYHITPSIPNREALSGIGPPSILDFRYANC